MMMVNELYHKEIGRHPQRTSKTKPFINNYNWNGINFPSGKDDWEKFEKDNPICNMLKE